MKDKLADLCGNELLQNDFINTFYEIRKKHLEFSRASEKRGPARTRREGS